MRHWYVQNPEFFEEFKRSINSTYTTLHVVLENDIVYIRGGLILNAPDGRLLENYSIEIQIPVDYPKTVPIVREIGGRLPKTLDRHFNQPDETACLFFRDERYKYWPQGSTIIDFIEGPVRSFFIWQIEHDLNGGGLNFVGRGHGVNGIIQFYTELIGTDDKKVITRFLEYLTKKKVKGHWLCYCGSGEKMRNCHFDTLIDSRTKILRKDTLKSLEALKNLK